MSFATAAFAAASSPAMKTTSRSSRAGREPLAKVFQPIVLKAFTRRAPGMRFATSSLDVLSPRSMTRPTALYAFIASITIFPANLSAGGSASIFRYGSARRTASPNLAASIADRALAFGPMEDTNEANVAGTRELLTATWCPAFANSFAAVPPMCPAPMTPIRMYNTSGRPEHVRGLWVFGWAFRVFCLPETRSGGRGWPAPFPERTGMETPEPPAGKPRNRFGFSQVPRKVRWIVFSNAFGAIGFGYITVFITAYFPEIGVSTQVVGLLLGALGLAMVVSAAPLRVSFPFIQGRTGIDSHTIHVAALVITDGLGFVMPIALYIILRNVHETIRTREARPKGMDWKPLLRFSGINGLIGLGAGFFIPLVPTWLFLKFAVPDTWSGPLLALANVTIGLAATVSASLAKRYGPVRAIVMAQGLSTVFMFSLAFVTNAFAAAGLYLVRAALMNMSAPIGDSFLMGIVAPEQRGLASAVNSIIWRLPNSVTTILGGIFMAGGYYDIPNFLSTAFYLASISSFYIVFRDVRPSR